MAASTAHAHPPETVAPRRRRVLAYDALRTFAIVAVVGIHALMPLRTMLPAHAPARIFDDLLHFAVPLFVFISGALLWARPWPSKPGAYRHFLARRGETILLPYVVWASGYSALYVLMAADKVAAVRALPALVISGHVWYHLYFVPMLLGMYLVTPLACKIAQRSPELLVLAAYAVRIVLWPWMEPAVSSVAPDLVWSVAHHIAQHVPHMALGAWFALRAAQIPRWAWRAWPAWLAGGFAVLLAAALDRTAALPGPVQALVYPVGMALVVLGFAFAAFELEPHYDRFASLVVEGGVLAFGVYFVHPALLAAVRAVVPDVVWTSAWTVPVTWAAVAAASFAISWALTRSPRTSWLMGVRASASG